MMGSTKFGHSDALDAMLMRDGIVMDNSTRPSVFGISPSARIRTSPYHDALIREGVEKFTVYNHMLLPTSFGDPEAEYWRLIEGVSQWDVSCERQIEVVGPDAAELAQMLVVRDISKCKVGQGKYVPICNHDGVLINDPILLKMDDNRFWFSIADSDFALWARAIAAERGMNVQIFEAAVSPMAVQGPKAETVVASIFGDWVKSLKYFWFHEAEIEGMRVAVQRSGWSKQGGFEIYLMDENQGDRLWNLVREAGEPYDIGPGNPNWCERIESGLLSYGGDTDEVTNPFEVRMGNYVNLDIDDSSIGVKALRDISKAGVKRHQLGLMFEDSVQHTADFNWYDIEVNGEKIGDLTNMTWSRRLNTNIGFALVSREANAGDQVELRLQERVLPAKLVELPFI